MHQGVVVHRIGLAVVAALLALLGALVAGAVSAPHASAQGTDPVCEEYPNLPQCEEDQVDDGEDDEADDRDGQDDEATALPGGGGPTASGSGGGGNLPFTGYPVSSLVLLLIALLAAGAALRGYLALRERLASRSDGLT